MFYFSRFSSLCFNDTLYQINFFIKQKGKPLASASKKNISLRKKCFYANPENKSPVLKDKQVLKTFSNLLNNSLISVNCMPIFRIQLNLTLSTSLKKLKNSKLFLYIFHKIIQPYILYKWLLFNIELKQGLST